MREIVLDTETTGFDPHKGDRLIEIGCVEIMHGVATGRNLHLYINPERDVPASAVAVHGLTEAFLRDKPVFAEVVGDFLDFIGDDTPLVIHNAAFDTNFLNYEMGKLGFPALKPSRIVDTLQMAREKFPGSPASLDALCRRFEIDNTNRTLHGALLDSQLLALVYVELTGGKQRGFDLMADAAQTVETVAAASKALGARTARIIELTDAQKAAHEALLDKLKDPLWTSA